MGTNRSFSKIQTKPWQGGIYPEPFHLCTSTSSSQPPATTINSNESTKPLSPWQTVCHATLSHPHHSLCPPHPDGCLPLSWHRNRPPLRAVAPPCCLSLDLARLPDSWPPRPAADAAVRSSSLSRANSLSRHSSLPRHEPNHPLPS